MRKTVQVVTHQALQSVSTSSNTNESKTPNPFTSPVGHSQIQGHGRQAPGRENQGQRRPERHGQVDRYQRPGLRRPRHANRRERLLPVSVQSV